MPPAALRGRVQRSAQAERFDSIGRDCRDAICRALPEDFSFAGARVLDFGCGAGRTLRHFVPEAEACEFQACDIDGESVAWLRTHLSPPFGVFQNDPEPPLPLAAGSLDLVYAVSVFTHLAASWAGWLLELHRVLAPGGLLFATYQGRGLWPLAPAARRGVPYDDRIGMLVEGAWRSFEDAHGPNVWHSEWWLRERWGRGFEVLDHASDGFGAWPGDHEGQGWVLLRRRDVDLKPEDLELPGEDPREAPAAALAASEAEHEIRHVRRERDDLAAQLAAIRASKLMRWTERPRRAWYRMRG